MVRRSPGALVVGGHAEEAWSRRDPGRTIPVRRASPDELVPRRSDGRPVSRPVPAWVLAGIGVVCALVIAAAVYAAATGRTSRVLVVYGGAGLVVTSMAWRTNRPSG